MMSNEEWERKVEFLLNNQAQFDIDMRRIEATQTETSHFLAQIADNLAKQSYVMFAGFNLTKAEIRELNAKIDAEIQALKDSQQQLTKKVDRLTGEDQNGS